MAANYSQYTDHNEIGGVSVGLEDAKLAAADSVDEVASTDCVLMKDASGNPVKILKEDFNEAVRDALGSILANSELGASIGRVAALGSSDNDFGSISTSDLTSVLGVGAFLFKAKKGTADAYEFTVSGLEDAYQAADNYKIFSGESNAGYELGWLCFKQQSNSYSAIGIGFSLKIATSPLFLLRNNNSEWEAYRLCLNK